MSTEPAPPVSIAARAEALVAVVDRRTFDLMSVYAAAFTFIDRAFVHVADLGGDRLEVTLRPKAPGESVLALEADLEGALWQARLHRRLSAEGKAFVDSIMLRGLGAPEDAGAGAAALPPLSDEELAAFDDPLGIAQSWEEKHKKKAE